LSTVEFDIDELYERAYVSATSRGAAAITREELDPLILELQTTTDWKLQASLIRIIGYAGAHSPLEYSHVLEPYLTHQLHCREVLWILCEEWNLTAKYLDTIKELIRGMPWPERYQCRLEAVDSATRYLYKHEEPDLLQTIIDLYEEHPRDANLRGLAYNSLWHIVGEPNVSEAQVISMAKTRVTIGRC
jgi:hypothetical protein